MVKITGGFGAKLGRIGGPGKTGRIGQALKAAGDLVAVHAQISITSGSQGGEKHIPSLPGQPPNNDTGVLANNIEVIQVRPLKVEVSSNAPYSAALELGTSKMAARPFMGPAVQAKKEEVIALVARAASEGMK
jgi:HK97 gp10 family phage protein